MATPGHFAWQSRSIETTGKRLFTRHSDQFSPGPIGDPETITEVVLDPTSGKVIERGMFKQDWASNLQLSAMEFRASICAVAEEHDVAEPIPLNCERWTTDRVVQRSQLVRWNGASELRASVRLSSPGPSIGFGMFQWTKYLLLWRRCSSVSMGS